MLDKYTIFWTLLISLLFVSTGVAQNHEVSGTVVDAETGETLPGVNIFILGTTQGTTSDLDGNYTLTSISDDDMLVFSYVGYERLEMGIDGREVIHAQLSALTLLGDELVVVGYGVLRERDVSGSVVKLDQSRFNQSVVSSVDQLLQGAAPGVQVVQNTGEPGGGMSISIRGVGSISGGTSPLYVIDGLPINNGVLISGTGNQIPSNGSPRNPLSSLNPSDIESIEILKDASATAIYGSRGANGVIMVTTKNGSRGALQVNYNGTFGIQNTHERLNLLEPEEYKTVVNSLIDAGQGNESERVSNIADGGTDWQDEIFRENALMQTHDLSFSWGNETTSYLVSVNNTDQDGLIEGSSYERYNARFNLRYDTDKFKLGFNTNISHIEDEFVPYGFDVNERSGVVNAAKLYDPTLTLYNEDGSYAVTQFANLDNPVALINGTHMDAGRDRYFGTMFGEYYALPNLSVKLNVGGDINNENKNIYKDRTTVAGNALGGIATVYNAGRLNYLVEGTVNYIQEYEKHRINAVAGITTQKFIQNYNSLQGNNFNSDATKAFDMNLADRSTLNAGSSKASNTLLSYLGRVNYSFNDKYNVTATYRIDGSSRFGRENRFGFFPSVSVGWLVDQEDFFSPLSDIVTMFKLRASWGETGNQEIGNNRSLITFNSGRTLVLDDQFVNTLKPSRIANPDLKWETTEQVNVGLDMGFLDNKMSASLDWFWKNTSDMLLSLPVPRSTGYGSKLVNMGGMVNKGLEFSLSSHNVDNMNFSWRSDLNVTTLKNEVKDLGQGIDRILTGRVPSTSGNSAIITPGMPIRSFYGYEVESIWQLDETAEAAQYGNVPGQFRFKDLNGDGAITAEDRKNLGNSIPDLSWGFGNTINYKSWEFHVFIEGVTGVKMLNGNLLETYFPKVGSVRANKLAEPLLNRWTPDNPTNDEPSFINPNGQIAQAVNSRTVVDASYIKLQTVRLAYTLPQNFIRTASVYVTGQNLLTISDYNGFDPALNPGGDANFRIDWNGYPSSRSFIIGVNLGF